jgi:hypothetical protein
MNTDLVAMPIRVNRPLRAKVWSFSWSELARLQGKIIAGIEEFITI